MIAADIKIAVRSLAASKIRTSLTILGVVIGVAAVTSVLALGEGAKQYVTSQVSTDAKNLLVVRSGKPPGVSAGELLNYRFLAGFGQASLNQEDLDAVSKAGFLAAPLVPIAGTVGLAPGKNTPLADTVLATTPELAKVLGIRMRSGGFIDNSASSGTAVVGFDLAERLLGSDVSLGQNIFIRGQPFAIAGIMAQYDRPASFDNPFNFNDSVLISLPAGQMLTSGTMRIQQIDIRLPTGDSPVKAKTLLRTRLLANHDGQPDFAVLLPGDGIQLADNLLRLVTTLVSIIASISLLVGGVGVMNIMLVSVAERTREIGIRKTVGATNGQILRQFVIESLIMSLAGGLIGVTLAYVCSFSLGLALGFLPAVSWQIITLGLGLALVTGLVFGTTPAAIAARKDPIAAIRALQ